MKKNILFVLIALSFIIGCVATQRQRLEEKGLEAMSSEEIRDALSGNTLKGETAKGTAFTATYNADGTCKVSWSGGSGSGTWYFKDGKYCSRFETRDNKEKCVDFYKTGENEYTAILSNGSLDGVMWVEK